MRTAFINKTIGTTTSLTGSVIYPDEMCFVFNPLYLDITLSGTNSLRVVVGDSKVVYYDYFFINVSLYQGRTKVYLSKMIQLLFTDYYYMRSKSVAVRLIHPESETEIFSCTMMAIWGNLELGDKFNSYGAFVYDNEKMHFERNLVWFKNFPFRVSMYRHEDEELLAKYDKSVYDDNLLIKRGCFHSIIDSEALPEYSTDSYSGNVQIYYFSTHKLFLAFSSSTNTYYSNWGEGHGEDYIPDNTRYNDKYTGLARTDAEWLLDGNVYKYNDEAQGLVIVDSNKHIGNSKGIIELDPSYTFPLASNKATYKLKGEGKGFSLFDSTFDYTFFANGESSVLVNMRVSNERDGYYIRWIDRFGFIQYYLFAKGKITIKTKQSDGVIEVDGEHCGINFANYNRPHYIETKKTVKCCAVNLPSSISEYVESIVTSPITDLYLGKTKEGVELWVPIKIVDGSYVREPNKVLRDFEISFTYPDVTTQSL